MSLILSQTSFLDLYSQLFEKQTVSDLFSLQNVAAVNKANKVPTWTRKGWKYILDKVGKQACMNLEHGQEQGPAPGLGQCSVSVEAGG